MRRPYKIYHEFGAHPLLELDLMETDKLTKYIVTAAYENFAPGGAADTGPARGRAGPSEDAHET